VLLMFGFEEFMIYMIYAYFFNEVFRLSYVFGVSYGMYVKLYFSAIASFAAFAAAILILVKSRNKPTGKLTVLFLSIAAFAGGITTLAVATASYFYITYPSLFTFIPETTRMFYRVHFVTVPLVGLFFWLFFSQLLRVKRAVIYLVVTVSLIVVFLNSIATITAEEVQLMLSVNMNLVFSLITLSYWLGTFIIITLSFFYYASKQKDERRIMGAILGTAGISAIMVQVSNIFALLLSNTVLEASVWIFAAAAFTLMYFGLLPPKRLLPKGTKGK